MEVLAGELPLERLGDLLEVAAELKQRPFEGVEVGEVVGLEHFALGNGEVDLRLVEPAGVHRGEDEDQVFGRSRTRAARLR